MQKLILILLVFFAVFTYIRAYEKTEISLPDAEISSVISVDLPVEINR